VNRTPKFYRSAYLALLTLPGWYADKGLCNGWASVRPSVRPSVHLSVSHRSTTAPAAGGFAAKRPVDRRHRSTALRAGANYIQSGDADVSCTTWLRTFWRRHSHVSPTCRTDADSGPPPLNSLTFRPVVGHLSKFVPFLLLEQRCGMACRAMLRRPRRCRCSRTG